MPRIYKRKSKQPSYRKYDAEKIQEAIQGMKDKNLSLRRAAQIYDINYSVLFRHQKRGNQMKKQGGQTVFSEEEENLIVESLLVCAKWGYPVDAFELRLILKDYLDRQGREVPKFKNNVPGKDFAYSFLKRHSHRLSTRLCQNIKRSRAALSRPIISEYFDNLAEELNGVPLENVINYDETNFSDDPGKKKIVVKRGCKYPERVMNSSKSATSVMFAVSGDGNLLPPYVVYKSTYLYGSWTEGGPQGARYNRTKSGWFDRFCFLDWLNTIVVPYCRARPGRKILLGDNLSSHLNLEAIELCQAKNISLVFLPPNSTHKTQPLDTAVFRPVKGKWRSVLTKWKSTPSGSKAASVPKDVFPRLLKEVFVEITGTASDTIKTGFRKCGIIPLNKHEVLKDIPCTAAEENREPESALQNSFEEFLKSMRYETSTPMRARRSRLQVVPGKSVSAPSRVEDGSEQVENSSAGTSSVDDVDSVDGADHDSNDGDSSDGANDGADGDSSDGDGADGDSSDGTDGDSTDGADGNSSEEVDAGNCDREMSVNETPDEPPATISGPSLTVYAPGQWVLVRFDGRKSDYFYVGQITANLDNGDYTVKFARKYGPRRFKWPQEEDICNVPKADIRIVLPEPEFEGNKSRKAVFNFDADFDGLTVL